MAADFHEVSLLAGLPPWPTEKKAGSARYRPRPNAITRLRKARVNATRKPTDIP